MQQRVGAALLRVRLLQLQSERSPTRGAPANAKAVSGPDLRDGDHPIAARNLWQVVTEVT